MKSPSLESLKGILKDSRNWIMWGLVEEVAAASDLSVIRVKVSVFPDNTKVIARVGWGSCGPSAGIMGPISARDLVVLALPDGDEDNAVVIARMSSREDKIPQQVVDGDTIVKALEGMKLHLASLERINIGLGNPSAQPTQNLVLGQVFKQMMTDLLSANIQLCTLLSTHTHTASGSPTTPPIQASQFLDISSDYSTIKSSPIEDGEILSDLAFTEKG